MASIIKTCTSVVYFMDYIQPFFCKNENSYFCLIVYSKNSKGFSVCQELTYFIIAVCLKKPFFPGNKQESNFGMNLYSLSLSLSFFFFFFCFSGLHLRLMKVPRLGVELELQLLAYTTAHSNARSLTH